VYFEWFVVCVEVVEVFECVVVDENLFFWELECDFLLEFVLYDW